MIHLAQRKKTKEKFLQQLRVTQILSFFMAPRSSKHIKQTIVV